MKKKRWFSIVLSLVMLVGLLPTVTLTASAATAPTTLFVEPSETNGIPAQIDLFQRGNDKYELYLPGNAILDECYLSWDGDATATVDKQTYSSGSCPIPPVNQEKTYRFKYGNTTTSLTLITYQGSPSVQPVFIEIDESDGHTIALMDENKNNTCSGTIYIGGTPYELSKMKGRGNATWDSAKDKKPYNITLGSKINFPGVDSDKTKKWSFLAEVTDHSLMSNRSGYHLGYELGIGQDTTSADVWMNGEYQGCYTVTPKTDSFVTKNGFMIEQDNYKEPAVTNGGDPQFQLEGLLDGTGFWVNQPSGFNRITVKKMGDNLLGKNEAGEVDESPDRMESVAINEIKPWLQDAWDAIRSESGYNSKGKYYTDYIDIESFAKMYLMHEYAKSFDVCAGSILFYREGMTDADKLIAGPVWDLDNAMGSTCQNSSLGNADDRRNGDRRRGDGEFIPLVEEYKTSIYKTISKHNDFMEEVSHQYNKNHSAFDSLPEVVDQMKVEIADSAKMNHYKVNDITGQYKNVHKYGSETTLGSNPYQQIYLATTNSKTDWDNYVTNLKTYVTVRSLWFRNTYYNPNDPANCEHEFENTTRMEPTCDTPGSITNYCPKCGTSYTESIPALGHDFNEENGTCNNCPTVAPKVIFSCTEGASVTVYKTQNLDGESVEKAFIAYPRDSSTGSIDCSGDGQINFVVNLEPGNELVSVTAAPDTSYKNLKGPSETKIENGYRLTKVTDNVTVTITTTKAPLSEVKFSHSCSFDNNLTINYYVPATFLEGYDSYYLELLKQVFNGNEESWYTYQINTCSDRTNNEIAYKVFSFSNIAAKEMGNDIKAILHATKNGETESSQEDVYSVKTYAYNRLNASTNDNFKYLLVDMLNYGAAAQTYFGYNTVALVNSELTEEQKYYASTDPQLESIADTIPNLNATSRFYGKTVILGNSVELKYYMTFNSGTPADTVKLVLNYTSIDNSNHTVTIPASEFKYNSEYEAYGASLNSIAAKDMSCPVTAEIYDGDNCISNTVIYSIETYAFNRIKSSKDENFKSLVKEMMKYGKSAESYFKKDNQ